MGNKRGSKQQVLAEIKVAPMTAGEKRMWKEYAELLRTKPPRAVLKGWERKHNVKLRGRDRVEFERHHLGPTTSAQEIDCAKICPVIGYGGSESVAGRIRIEYECYSDGCEWNHDQRRWECKYACFSKVVRVVPD